MQRELGASNAMSACGIFTIQPNTLSAWGVIQIRKAILDQKRIRRSVPNVQRHSGRIKTAYVPWSETGIPPYWRTQIGLHANPQIIEVLFWDLSSWKGDHSIWHCCHKLRPKPVEELWVNRPYLPFIRLFFNILPKRAYMLKKKVSMGLEFPWYNCKFLVWTRAGHKFPF